MDKKVKVIFEPLPKEGIFVRIYRKIFKKPRFNEYVRVGLNGKMMSIKRGVEVEIKSIYLTIIDKAPLKDIYGRELKYKYKIV